MKKALIIGPGYVGREIIDLLRAEGNYSITTLVRRELAAEEFKNDGVDALMGDLNDTEKIQALAKESDLVFHTATSDHVPSAKAICDGIRERAAAGKHTIYLHQSGASVLADGAAGDVGNAKVYSDLAPQDIDALADDAPHRPIDLEILKARKEVGAAAKIFIMMPPIIYGNNPKYSRLSIQIPTLTRFALRNGYAGVVGAGKGAWGVVHVLDLAKAYLHILHWLEDSPPDSVVSNPYFFCESGEATWAKISELIGTGLHKAGKVEDPKPKEVPRENWDQLFGDITPAVVACNSRCRADRLRSMGWKPVQKNVQQAFEDEDLPVLLKEQPGSKASDLKF